MLSNETRKSSFHLQCSCFFCVCFFFSSLAGWPQRPAPLIRCATPRSGAGNNGRGAGSKSNFHATLFGRQPPAAADEAGACLLSFAFERHKRRGGRPSGPRRTRQNTRHVQYERSPCPAARLIDRSRSDVAFLSLKNVLFF